MMSLDDDDIEGRGEETTGLDNSVRFHQIKKTRSVIFIFALLMITATVLFLQSTAQRPNNVLQDISIAPSYDSFVASSIVQDETTKTTHNSNSNPSNSTSEEQKIRSHRKQFLLAILPDSQYYAEGAPYILESQLRWLSATQSESGPPLKYVLHVGDLVQAPTVSSQWDVATDLLQHYLGTKNNDDYGDVSASIPYAIVSGNHDLVRSTVDDMDRSPWEEPYWQHFANTTNNNKHSPRPYAHRDPVNGYNEYHLVRDDEVLFLILCLDYRASPSTMEWACQVLEEYHGIPTILLTHDLLVPSEPAVDKTSNPLPPHRSEFGTFLWQNLIAKSDQIFWTINGHYTVDSSTVSAAGMLKDENEFGNDVIMTVMNYQHLHAGGNGYLRLVELILDEENGRMDMNHLTFSPFVMELYENATQSYDTPPMPWTINLEHDILQRTNERDDFSASIPMDSSRFPNITATNIAAEEPPTPSASLLDPIRDYLNNVKVPILPTPKLPVNSEDYPRIINDTVAHWRFHGHADNELLPINSVLQDDVSGKRNDLTVQTLLEDGSVFNNATNEWLRWSSDHHPLSSSAGSLCFDNPHRYVGSFLTTVAKSPIELISFETGYTIESFVRLSPTWSPDEHRWTAIVAKRGEGQHAAHEIQGEPKEPLALLGVSASRELQWATFAENRPDLATAWSSTQPRGEWFHVAAVNDGYSTTLYVDGTPARRDPVHQTPLQGLAMATESHLNGWTIGASTYDGEHKVFGNGCIGEVRVVARALEPMEFLLSR